MARVAEVYEIDPLDDAAVGDVEAGNDADADGHGKMPPKPVRAELVEAPFFSSTSKKDGPSTSSRRTEEGIALSLILAPPQSLRPDRGGRRKARGRSEEHTSELQSLMRISYSVFCLKKKS